MRKIVIIGPAYPLRGGIAAFTERLATELDRYSDDVRIETYSLQYPKFLFPGKTQYSTGPISCHVRIRSSLNSINPLNWIRLGWRLKNEKPDYVIFKFWIPFMAPALGSLARIIKRNKHTKCIGLAHNILPHENKIGDHILADYFVNAMDGFMVLSDSVMKDLSLFDYVNPIRISPHPLYDHFGKAVPKQIAIEKLKLNPEWNYMLFFGFVREYKGLDIALEALATEKVKALKVKLIVAGEFYTNKQVYLDMINELEISDRVIFQSDYIPDQDVPNYFSAADLIIQPYKEATQSGVTQIAYHFNKPILVTKVGGLPELVPHMKAGYVADRDAESIGKYIYDFYTNEREKEFIPHILSIKKLYSWDLFVQQFNELTKDIEKS